MKLRTLGGTKIVGALALLMLTGAGWMLLLGPKTEALAAVHEATQSAREQNETLALHLLTLAKKAEDLEDTRAVAEALAEKFPPTADQPGLFRQVTEAAADAGIPPGDLTALTPTPPTIGAVDPATGVAPTDGGDGDLARQTVTVSVTGDYAATQELLENLESMPRAFLATSVTVTGGEVESGFTTTVTGDMFVMPPAPDPDAAPQDVTAPDGATGDSASTATP